MILGIIEEEKSILEIKCFPSLARNNQDMLSAARERKNFPLYIDSSGSLQINKKHNFYYQVSITIIGTKVPFRTVHRRGYAKENGKWVFCVRNKAVLILKGTLIVFVIADPGTAASKNEKMLLCWIYFTNGRHHDFRNRAR